LLHFFNPIYARNGLKLETIPSKYESFLLYNRTSVASKSRINLQIFLKSKNKLGFFLSFLKHNDNFLAQNKPILR